MPRPRRHQEQTQPASGLCALILVAILGACSEEPGAKNPEASSSAEQKKHGEAMVVDAEGRTWRRGPDLERQWPDDPRVDIAKELLASHNYVDAEIVLTGVLKNNPKVARAQFLRGIAIQKQMRYQQALEELDASLATAQMFPEARHGEHFRGWCLYHLGRAKEAKEAFEKHIEMFPEEGDSHFGLAVVSIEDGQLQDAQPHLERAIELQKDNPSRRRELAKAHARLGDVHLSFDRLELARKSYHTAVIRWPDHYEAWAKLARVLDRLDRSLEAERARNEQRNAMIRVGRSVDEESAG